MRKTDSMRALRAVRPSDVSALQDMAERNDGTLERLVREVRREVKATRADRDPEVEAYASLICARLHRDDVRVTARVAVAYARTIVADAWSGVDSLDAWAGQYGDMVEAHREGGDALNLPRPYTSDPARCAHTGTHEVLGMVLADAPAVLRDAARAYARHEGARVLPAIAPHTGKGGKTYGAPEETVPGTCDLCADPTTAGRRPALAGILAHTREVDSTDAEYHRLRRLTVGALGDLPTAEVMAETADMRRAPRAPWSDKTRALSTALGTRPAPREDTRALPDTDVVTVRTADGRTAVRSHRAIVKGADAPTAEDKRAEQIAGAAPRGAVAKPGKGKGTGAYGPQVDRRSWQTLGMTSG